MGSFQGTILGSLLTLLGWDGSAFRNILVDADGHLQVDALTAQLITGFATATNQTELLTRIGPVGVPVEGTVNRSLADIKTAVRLIDDLYGALHSVSTDELLAYVGQDIGGWTHLDIDTGGRLVVSVTKSTLPTDAATEASLQGIEDMIPDQQVGYADVYRERVAVPNADAGTNTLSGTAVPANKLYVVTSMAAYDSTAVPTRVSLGVLSGGTWYSTKRLNSPAISEGLSWSGKLILEEGEKVEGIFEGVAANDNLYFFVNGWEVTDAA